MYKDYSWKKIIDDFLQSDRLITEIETNGSTSLFLKEKGRRVEVKNVFENRRDYIEKTKELAKLIDSDNANNENYEYPEFLLEGRLSLTTGSSARVHIVLPPACDVPQVTIAKKSTQLATLKSIKETGSLNTLMYDFLKAAIKCNRTIVISGGTGSGKTTMLEALTREFSEDDRIGVVEDSPELKLVQKNVTYLHSTLWVPGTDPNSVATLSWCVQQINRQRTDKLIIGETRGKEFADFITGANSGMEGSLTTIHANNAKSALSKMNQFISEALPQVQTRTVNEKIANAVDIIIQLGFDRSGKNRIISIDEVSDTIGNTDSAQIATQSLFEFNEDSNSWNFSSYTTDKLRNVLQRNNFDIKNFKEKNALKASSSLPLNKLRRGDN